MVGNNLHSSSGTCDSFPTKWCDGHTDDPQFAHTNMCGSFGGCVFRWKTSDTPANRNVRGGCRGRLNRNRCTENFHVTFAYIRISYWSVTSSTNKCPPASAVDQLSMAGCTCMRQPFIWLGVISLTKFNSMNNHKTIYFQIRTFCCRCLQDTFLRLGRHCFFFFSFVRSLVLWVCFHVAGVFARVVFHVALSSWCTIRHRVFLIFFTSCTRRVFAHFIYISAKQRHTPIISNWMDALRQAFCVNVI